MGNCEKSMYYERQKSRQQAQQEAQSQPPPQNDSERASYANDKIVIPASIPQKTEGSLIKQSGSAIRQSESSPAQLCKLISNYG